MEKLLAETDLFFMLRQSRGQFGTKKYDSVSQFPIQLRNKMFVWLFLRSNTDHLLSNGSHGPCSHRV